MKQNRLSLNDVEWGEFNVQNLFEKIIKGKCSNQNSQTMTSRNGISYLSATRINNGVSGFVEKNNITLKGNCIMFINQGDGGAGYCVYKSEDFISTTSNSFGYANWINKYTGLFFSTISSKLKEKYSFGYGRTESRLKRDKIMLPIDKNNNPNWQFMEDYIKQEQKDIAKKVINYYEQKMLETSFDLVGFEDVEWKTHTLRDIFKVESVKGKTISKYEEGIIPYVSTSSQTNGVSGFIETDKNISNRKCISIDPIAGNAFYHDYKFVGRGGAGSAINLLYNKSLNKYNAQFIISSLEKVSKEKASYGTALNGRRLKETKIILPIDKNGEPHWEYMSQFMKKIETEKLQKVLEYIYIYRLAISYEKKLLPLNKKEWKEFWIEDIVTIKSGKDIYERERIDGNTPYVTATAQNNGIGYFVDNINKTLEEKAISVNRNGSVGYAFYHDYKALYGNDTRKLIPKYKNKHISLFLTSVITKQREKYGYGYKMGTGRLKRQKILLPIDELGNIDFDYMRKYMQIKEIKEQYKILEHYYEIIK